MATTRKVRRDLLSACSVAAVVVAVAIVSLPSLRAFAVRENEEDAARLVATLCARARVEPEADLRALARLDGRPRERVADAAWNAEQRLLSCHGYLFDLARNPSDGAPLVAAWPLSFGSSGRRAFVCLAASNALTHANEDGRYHGYQRRVDLAPLAFLTNANDSSAARGWQPLSPPP